MASTYLTRTMSGGSATTTKFTISVWVKRAGLNNDTIVSCSNDYCYLGFNSGNKLFLELHDIDNVRLRTNALFRDTNAWYHIVASYDSTQSTASDRMKLYVNNEQITSFNVANYPSQNYGAGFGGNLQHSVGRREIDDSEYFSGVISHLHLCAGYTYDASAFGEYDANGVWKIKTDVSVTYGTNGFFILKDGNSVTDESGNGNNFTVAGGTLTKTEDSPSNVFPTLMVIPRTDAVTTNPQLSNGNTTVNFADTVRFTNVVGSIACKGKYYWEVKATGFSATTTTGHIGLTNLSTYDNGNMANFYIGYRDDGVKNNYGTTASYGASYGSGDIIGVAFDSATGTIWFSKNGTWQNSATISEIATGTTTNSAYTGLSTSVDWQPVIINYDNRLANVNFGNGYFGTTAVASAGTNASGIGIFEYDVPTGYTALSTKGLNL